MHNAIAIVVTENGTLIVPNTAHLVAWMEARGFTQDGETRIGGALRPELQGQPTFEGLIGPMWGGEAHPLRYESKSMYDMLST